MKPIIKEKKKQKKFFNWGTIWSYLRTLFKNDAVVQCSLVPRKSNDHKGAKYWWLGIPVFLASIALAMTPTTVQAGKQHGRAMFSGQSLNFDRALFDVLTYKDAAEGENVSYAKSQGDFDNIVIDHHKATYTGDGVSQVYKETKSYYLGGHKALSTSVENPDKDSKKTTEGYVKDFDFYYVSGKNFHKILDLIKDYTYSYDSEKNTVDVVPFTDKTFRDNLRDCPYIVFGEKNFAVGVDGKNQPIVGDYEHIKNGSFADYLSKGIDFTDGNEAKQTKKVWNNYLTWTDEMFTNNRARLIGVQAGVSIGTNAGIILLIGFIMWLLTRGKQNPNRYIKFYETLNMSFWSSFTPALLALILGFIFPGFSMMGFLIFFGFRAMWLSMKYLRPQRYTN